MVSVNYKQQKFRFFLGDVNDFTNLGCLYFMDSVVSVGDVSYSKRVFNLYKEKKKKVTINGHELSVSPFKSSPFTPKSAIFTTIDHNAKRINFTVARRKSAWRSAKSLLFYHLYNKQITVSKDVRKILKGLSKNTKKKVSNVLFIADHLEPHSLYLWKFLLAVYGKFQLKKILRITYRRIRIFSGIVAHSHSRSKFHAHIQH